MTTQDYIQYIQEDFQSGKRYIEIKTNEPRKLYTRLRYKVYTCKLHWHFQIMDESLIIRPGAAPKTRTPKQKKCICNQYSRCTECRNRERRAADKENRMPVYLLGKIAPDVYQICLEVAASD
jgi:hypothetical protein